MNPSQILKNARELLTPPDAWHQGASARDNLGAVVMPAWEEAVCWCASGAIHRVQKGTDSSRGSFAYLVRVIGTDYVPEWNDDPDRTHDEVLAAFDAAIKLAEADE